MPESVEDRPTRSHEYVFLLTKSAHYYYDSYAIREAHSEESLARVERGRSNSHKWADGGPGGQILAMDISRACHPGGRNKRSVWWIATQPFPQAHFATFPEALVEPCILAGTSEKGACASCGAPWARIIERTTADRPIRDSGKSRDAGVDRRCDVAGQEYQEWREANPPKSVGWKPGCDCGVLSTHPCVVLDPFLGSGTTGLVALKAARNFVGIELNPEYAAMARSRLAQEASQARFF